MKKLVRATKLNDEHYEKNFTILLNVLHFLTKKVYVSSDTLRKRENENPQHNEEVKDSQPSTLREKPRKLTSVVNGELPKNFIYDVSRARFRHHNSQSKRLI